MIVVTGGAGFIGSNLVRGLNEQGIDDVLVVDNMENSEKYHNLVDCRVTDYMDKRAFHAALEGGKLAVDVEAILHQGACTNTMEYNGRYMLDNNFAYSKMLLHTALARRIPFIYASSAAVYGGETTFNEDPANERPLNIYGYSKLLFDQYVRRLMPSIESPVVGLRYFNVYGPRETHKGPMASVIYQFYWQLREQGVIQLYEGTDGYGDGEQRRDFIFVGDVVAVNLYFLGAPAAQGVWNVGTGQSRSFNDIARTLIDLRGGGEIVYIPFPVVLQGRYQSYTQADVSTLRVAGYDRPFTSLEDGIAAYFSVLEQMPGGGKK